MGSGDSRAYSMDVYESPQNSRTVAGLYRHKGALIERPSLSNVLSHWLSDCALNQVPDASAVGPAVPVLQILASTGTAPEAYPLTGIRSAARVLTQALLGLHRVPISDCIGKPRIVGVGVWEALPAPQRHSSQP